MHKRSMEEEGEKKIGEKGGEPAWFAFSFLFLRILRLQLACREHQIAPEKERLGEKENKATLDRAQKKVKGNYEDQECRRKSL